jgi:broad specificity phosphatase PhoE
MSPPVLDTTLPALWLVRHGESTWNISGLAQGHNDEAELTERGLRQAAQAAGQFRDRPVRAIYASDLRRAQQTAAEFAAVLGLPVYPDARLRERSLGVLEGSAHKTIGPSLTGLADGLVIDPDARPPAGESVRDLYLRAAAFFDDLAAGLRYGHGTLGGLTGAVPASTGPGSTVPAGAVPAASTVPGSTVPGSTVPASTVPASTVPASTVPASAVPASVRPGSNDGDVLVIAHGGTVRVLDAYIHGVPVDQMTWRPVDNATIVRIPGFGTPLRGGNR